MIICMPMKTHVTYLFEPVMIVHTRKTEYVPNRIRRSKHRWGKVVHFVKKRAENTRVKTNDARTALRQGDESLSCLLPIRLGTALPSFIAVRSGSAQPYSVFPVYRFSVRWDRAAVSEKRKQIPPAYQYNIIPFPWDNGRLQDNESRTFFRSRQKNLP